jgi:hypothetical protein
MILAVVMEPYGTSWRRAIITSVVSTAVAANVGLNPPLWDSGGSNQGQEHYLRILHSMGQVLMASVAMTMVVKRRSTPDNTDTSGAEINLLPTTPI